MSSKSLHALLIEACERLQETIDTDVRDRAIIGSDLNSTTRIISEYLRIYTMFEECYDQTIQTQRRITIRDLLIRTITRLLQLYWLLTRPTVLQVGQGEVVWPTLAASIMTQAQSITLEIPTPRIVKDDTGPAYQLR
jgi:hypothetical protein